MCRREPFFKNRLYMQIQKGVRVLSQMSLLDDISLGLVDANESHLIGRKSSMDWL